MQDEYDFSNARRGAVLVAPGKTRISIVLDDEIVDQLRTCAAGSSQDVQSLIAEALRQYLSKSSSG